MNIVLVCLNNFQEYILINIEQLIRLGHENIYILTNNHLFKYFDNVKTNIKLIDVDKLDETYNFYSRTTLDKNFRNGFWTLTSLRFFYIYEFMSKFNITDVIHLENDVLIYYNCNTILDLFDKKYMYIPFDTYKRNIASIVYIPSCEVYKQILDNYDFGKNDMENFSTIKQKTSLIQNLPIFINYNSNNNEVNFVTHNFDKFKYIFDAAAIGQFLGGIDPKNNSDNTIGFVNETCIIKYNNFNFTWNIVDGVKKPFLNIKNHVIPIFNLHIHCKNLKKFI